jgi:hypothetical protein
MDTVRFFGLAAGMFAAVFLGMSWLLAVHPLQPDARLPLFQRVDKDSPRFQLEESSISDDDPIRDRLRHEVLDDAKTLSEDPCNPVLRKRYIEAANSYARAWISIVPCIATQTCGSGDSDKTDRAAQAFGSPLDLRVREAMQKAHKRAGFRVGDFPNDTVNLVALLAADGLINPHADVRLRQMALDNSTAQDCGH